MQPTQITRRNRGVHDRLSFLGDKGSAPDTQLSPPVTYHLPEIGGYPGSGKLEQVMSQRADGPLPQSRLTAARELTS